MLLTEIDPFCCRVLRKNFPDATVVERDICLLNKEDLDGYEQCHFFAGIGGLPLGFEWAGWTGPIWTGGFPCQDISTAGKGAGLEGARSGLWWEWFRLIRACRPPRLLIENVPALRGRGADEVLAALEAVGYTCWPIVVGAEAVGAPHRRERVWIVAHAVGNGAGGQRRLVDDCGRPASKGRPEGVSDAGGRNGGEFECDPEHAGELAHSEGDLRSPLARSISEGEATGARQARRRGVRQGLRSADDGGLANAGDEVADTAEQRLEVDSTAEPAGERAAASGSCRLADISSDGRSTEGRRDASGHHDWRGAWPSRPGEPQYEWEAPRLVESGVGLPASGLPGRLAGRRRREQLKALGNAVVPQVVEQVARAWMEADRGA